MGPDKRKRQVPQRDAAAGQPPAPERRAEPAEDEREEEGYSQPESSAQKGPAKPPDVP